MLRHDRATPPDAAGHGHPVSSAARLRIGRASTNISAARPPATAWIQVRVSGDTARPPSGQNVSGPVEAHQPEHPAGRNLPTRPAGCPTGESLQTGTPGRLTISGKGTPEGPTCNTLERRMCRSGPGEAAGHSPVDHGEVMQVRLYPGAPIPTVYEPLTLCLGLSGFKSMG